MLCFSRFLETEQLISRWEILQLMQKFKKGDRVVDLDFYSPETSAIWYVSTVKDVNGRYELLRDGDAADQSAIYLEHFGTTALVLESIFNSPVYQLLKDEK